MGISYFYFKYDCFFLYQIILTANEFNRNVSDAIVSDQTDYYVNIIFGTIVISFLIHKISKQN